MNLINHNIILVVLVFLSILEINYSYKNSLKIASSKVGNVNSNFQNKRINDCFINRCRIQHVTYNTNIMMGNAISMITPKNSFMGQLSKYLTSFISPSITGGFLAGGFHAISGKYL